MSHADFLKKLEEEEHGRFTIDSREGKAVLTVYAPGKKGKPVRLTDVLARLDLFAVSGYKKEDVQEIVDEADGEGHAICDWDMPAPRDASLTVGVSEDGFSAEISIAPPAFGGVWPHEKDLFEALDHAGIRFGIKKENLHAYFSSGTFDFERARRDSGGKQIHLPAAQGKRPIPGTLENVHLLFRVRTAPIPALADETGGRVDFKKLNIIQCCETGQLLASIVPGDPGTPGVNVFGDSIEPEKKAGSSLVAGSGTVFDPATRALHSTLAGQVIIHENESTYRIDVENVLRLKDVDYSTGHIDFPWSVIIEGTILDGFQVVSGGDIVVEKTVGSVTLRAKKDIQLGEGITGRDRAFVTAGGNVFAKFVQGSVINAGGGIFIEEAVMLSRLLAGGDIVLDAGRGELIGGLARAGRMVRARKIGSRLEVPTVVLVGISPEALAQLSALEEEIVSRMAVMHRVETHISQIEEAIKRGRSYEENQTETLEKLRAVRASGWAYLESLEKQRTVIAQSLSTNPESCVEALEEVFPGVEIRFGASVRKYSVGRNPIPDYSLFIRDGDSVVLRHSKF